MGRKISVLRQKLFVWHYYGNGTFSHSVPQACQRESNLSLKLTRGQPFGCGRLAFLSKGSGNNWAWVREASGTFCLMPISILRTQLEERVDGQAGPPKSPLGPSWRSIGRSWGITPSLPRIWRRTSHSILMSVYAPSINSAMISCSCPPERWLTNT